MKPPTHLQSEAGVYDPSNRRADTASYWQWTNSGLGEQWERAAEWVNLGWPSSIELKDRSARWYGVMFSDPCDFWVYRVFAAGKDRFGRDERYFFVLIRLRSTEEILSPHVAGLFSYFDTERGLPLKTEPLDHGWQGAAPDDILEAICQELDRGGRTGHWGMDAAGRTTVFSEGVPMPPVVPTPTSEQAPPPKPPALPRTRRTHKLNSGWALVAVMLAVPLYLILKPSHRQIKTPPGFPSNTKPGPPAAQLDEEPPVVPPPVVPPPDVQPPDTQPMEKADMATDRPQVDDGAIREDIPAKPKPTSGDKELPDPDTVPKADDDSTPDQASDPSQQPPTEPPAIPIRP
jgi:hypothetical protein